MRGCAGFAGGQEAVLGFVGGRSASARRRRGAKLMLCPVRAGNGVACAGRSRPGFERGWRAPLFRFSGTKWCHGVAACCCCVALGPAPFLWWALQSCCLVKRKRCSHSQLPCPPSRQQTSRNSPATRMSVHIFARTHNARSQAASKTPPSAGSKRVGQQQVMRRWRLRCFHLQLNFKNLAGLGAYVRVGRKNALY